MPTFSPVPVVVPTTDDPASFDARADLYLPWMATFRDELEANFGTIEGAVTYAAIANAAAAAAAGATSYSATSNSTINTASGSVQTFNLTQTGKAFAVNDAIVLVRRSDANTRCYGAYTTFNSGSGAGAITLNPAKSVGAAGSFSDWMVLSAALETVRPTFEADLQKFAIAMAVAF